MIIDRKKILVLHNTAYSSSKTVADYYVAARGLDPAHVIGINFGTSDTITDLTSLSSMLSTIANSVATNGIQAIVLSINIPARVRHYVTSPQYNGDSALCRVIGNASQVLSSGGEKPNHRPQVGARFISSTGFATISDAALTASEYVFNWLDHVQPSPASLPCGRLGYHAGMGSDDSALAIRCIDDAIYYERNGNPRAEAVVFGLSTRVAYMTHGNAYLAYSAMRSAIATAHVYDGNFDNRSSASYSAGYTSLPWSFSRPPVTIPSASQFLLSGRTLIKTTGSGSFEAGETVQSGTATGVVRIDGGGGSVVLERGASSVGWNIGANLVGLSSGTSRVISAVQIGSGTPTPIPVWGWIGLGAENIGDAWADSVSFSRGAWMLESTSSGVSKYALSRGACCAVVPVQEPYNLGLPMLGSLASRLIDGYSIEEAVFASTLEGVYGNSVEVWGDPLYSPFDRIARVDDQFTSESRITSRSSTNWASRFKSVEWRASFRGTTWRAQ